MFPECQLDTISNRENQPSSTYATRDTEAGLKKQQRLPIATDGSNPSNKNKWRDLQALHNWGKNSETFQLKRFWLNKFLGKSFELHAWSEPLQAQVQCGSKQVWYNMATIYAHYRVTSGFTNSFRFRTNTTLDHPLHEAIWMHVHCMRCMSQLLGIAWRGWASPLRQVLTPGVECSPEALATTASKTDAANHINTSGWGTNR